MALTRLHAHVPEASMDVSAPAHQAYQILHFGFSVAPIVAGLDKFADFLVDWSRYLSPTLARFLPIDGHSFMLVVGAVEVAAGVLVAIKPRIGAYMVAFWLWAIIINPLSIPGYYDIALRDFGLSMGALALGRLSEDSAH